MTHTVTNRNEVVSGQPNWRLCQDLGLRGAAVLLGRAKKQGPKTGRWMRLGPHVCEHSFPGKRGMRAGRGKDTVAAVAK